MIIEAEPMEAEAIEETESSGSPPHEPPCPELVQEFAGSLLTPVDVSKQRKEKKKTKKNTKKQIADTKKRKPEFDAQKQATDTAKKQKTDAGSEKLISDSNKDGKYQVHRKKVQGTTAFCTKMYGCTKQVFQVTEKKAGSVEKKLKVSLS